MPEPLYEITTTFSRTGKIVVEDDVIAACADYMWASEIKALLERSPRPGYMSDRRTFSIREVKPSVRLLFDQTQTAIASGDADQVARNLQAGADERIDEMMQGD